MIQASPTGAMLDGRYEVRSVLGGGASAVVYLARQTRVDRDVAIKVIRPEVFAHQRELERYLREARIIARLNHPNIVTLFDVGRLPDQRPYMVMEYIRGQSLNRTLRNDGYFPVDLAFQVFLQVARALAHAHRHGVIHRDIKPGNILLEHGSTGLARVRVADFGVASVASSNMTHEGSFIGTPMYMAPEQAQGEPVTSASDIYSLGVVMYRLFTGVKPFDADTPVALAMCHVHEPVRPMREVAPVHDIPEELDRVVLKCMAKDPADRYASCEELIEELSEVRVTLLPHLLGLSQESLEPLLVTADREDTLARAGTRRRVRGLLAMNAVALVACFTAGAVATRVMSPAPEIQQVEVERLVEVPVVPEETIVEVVEAPAPVPAAVAPAAPARPEAAAAPAMDAPPVDAAGGEARSDAPEAVAEAPAPGAAAAPSAPARVKPLVGYGGIEENWVGNMEGRPLELDLEGSPDGQVVGRLKLRTGPTWSTRDLVGRVEALSPERVRLNLVDLEGRHPVSLSVDVAHRAGRGALTLGDKSRAVTIEPR